MSEEAKETRADKPAEVRKPAEKKVEATKKDKSFTEMTPDEYSKRFNPVAAYLAKHAAKTDEDDK